MQRGEEKKRALADLSDEERHAKFEEGTEQMIAFLLGTES